MLSPAEAILQDHHNCQSDAELIHSVLFLRSESCKEMFQEKCLLWAKFSGSLAFSVFLVEKTTACAQGRQRGSADKLHKRNDEETVEGRQIVLTDRTLVLHLELQRSSFSNVQTI